MILGSDVDRRALRTALLEHAPWLADVDHGPSTVEAGDCDRCAAAPRVLTLCGPVAWQAACRDCAIGLGEDGWCAGHLEEGRAAVAWARRLPELWAPTVLLWWLATGELRALELTRGERAALPPGVAAALPR